MAGDQNDSTAELYGASLHIAVCVQIVPATAIMLVGEAKQFVVTDELGHQRFDATWTVSDPGIASITSGSSPTLTALAAGQFILAVDVQGVSTQLQITVAPTSLQVTPSAVNMQVGESRQFSVVDNLGHPSGDVTWTLNDNSLATVTSENTATLTAVAAGIVTLTATVEGVTAQADIAISPVGTFPQGTTLWSVPPSPGFYPIQIAQAVPTDNGPDLYSISLSGDSKQSTVQALSADGRQLWEKRLPAPVNNRGVPDGAGGLMVIEHNTCYPGQTDPLAIVDIDATGNESWKIQAAGIQTGNGVVYCYPTQAPPQIAVRGDGTIFISAPTNMGLPELTILTADGSNPRVSIPRSTYVNPWGITQEQQSLVGPPIVDSDGSAYSEYEVRHIDDSQTIGSSVLYLLKIATDNSTSTTVLCNNASCVSAEMEPPTTNAALLPGPIIPDGNGDSSPRGRSAPLSITHHRCIRTKPRAWWVEMQSLPTVCHSLLAPGQRASP